MDIQLSSDSGQDIDLIEFEACFHILDTALPWVSWAELILMQEENTTPEEILDKAYKSQADFPEAIRL